MPGDRHRQQRALALLSCDQSPDNGAGGAREAENFDRPNGRFGPWSNEIDAPQGGRKGPVGPGVSAGKVLHARLREHADDLPREACKAIILTNAAAFLAVHNHPSGDPTPSREQIQITRRLRQIADAFGVRFLDHVLIGTDRYVSFVDDGYWELAARRLIAARGPKHHPPKLPRSWQGPAGSLPHSPRSIQRTLLLPSRRALARRP